MFNDDDKDDNDDDSSNNNNNNKPGSPGSGPLSLLASLYSLITCGSSSSSVCWRRGGSQVVGAVLVVLLPVLFAGECGVMLE